MIEKDTIRLLRECDAGIKMGVDSINDVLNDVSNDEFKKLLSDCRSEHEKLNSEIQSLLNEYGDDGKDPNPMAKGMSWIKTNAKMAWDGSDNTIADLMTDGCNMGVKSLSKYLNQYKAASEKTKDIAKKLIAIEGTLSTDMRPYL